MKNIKIIVFLLICMLFVNVKADMGPPMITRHEVMVTNKKGAKCYNTNSKKDIIIPYGTTFMIDTDINNGYIYVQNDDYSCDVKSSDISSKTQKFSLDDKSVEKITPVKAIILSSNGLNMRKGPSVTFSKIITIPSKAIVKLTHKAGDYWYYCEYKDYSGWITGMNGYFGYDGKETLISYEAMKIYSTYDKKAVLGKIPANTEITDYINLVARSEYDIAHYVIYNGTVGYVEKMMYKTNGTGKIKLIKDFEVTSDIGEPIKKLTPQELEYNMIGSYGKFYLKDKKIEAYIPEDYYEYVNKVNVLNKEKGYVGEGLFGEAKEERLKEETNEESTKIETKDLKEPTSVNAKDIIIICLLSGIFIALTILVIIKLVNNKKNKKKINKKEENEYDNKEV